jgi:hypothetical protein
MQPFNTPPIDLARAEAFCCAKMTRSREFSYLEDYNLEACAIRGDGKSTELPETPQFLEFPISLVLAADLLCFRLGNCLFNALSDQIYGTQDRHAEIRQGVIQYMRENPNQFKHFLHVGGKHRRNPKRKNAGSLPPNIAFTAATDAEIDAAYEAHLTQMAQGGTWGDNHEIQAFMQAYNTDIRIYQGNGTFDMKVAEDGVVRSIAHIAYHVGIPLHYPEHLSEVTG